MFKNFSQALPPKPPTKISHVSLSKVKDRYLLFR